MNAQQDRLPPYDEEAERAALGSILQDNAQLMIVQEILAATDFYRTASRKIFEGMGRLSKRGVPIDDLTLKNEMSEVGELEAVGGPAYIASLADGIASPGNAKYYAGIVKEKAVFRELIRLASRIQHRAFTGEGQPSDLAADLMAEAQRIGAVGRISSGVGFPLRTWDLSVRAFESVVAVDWLVEPIMAPPDVISLVGDGGVGKSKVAASTALSVAFGKPLFQNFSVPKVGKVLYLNEERPDLTLRHFHTLAPSMGIIPEEIQNRVYLVGGGPQIWRVTDPAAIKKVIEYAQEKGEINLVIWDSLHVLHDKEENDNSEMTQVILGFKGVCASLGCCGLLLHHTGKGQIADPTQAARGATAIKDTVDGQFQVRRPKDEALNQLKVSQDKTRRSLVSPFILSLEHTEQGDITAVSWAGKGPTRTEEAIEPVVQVIREASTAIKSRDVVQQLAPKFGKDTVYAALKLVREGNLARWQGDEGRGYLYGGEPGDL